MSPRLGYVSRLTLDKVKEILRTRTCTRCSKKFRELDIRQGKKSKFLVAIHYNPETQKIEQHYLGIIVDPEVEKMLEGGEPAVRLSKIIKEDGTTLQAWLRILDELIRDYDYLIASEDDKEKLLQKLKETISILEKRKV